MSDFRPLTLQGGVHKNVHGPDALVVDILKLSAGAAGAGLASLYLAPGVVLAAPESGAVESDGTHLYWTNALGARQTLDNAASATLAATYNFGGAAVDQTLALLDAKGGTVIFDGTSGAFTGNAAVQVLGKPLFLGAATASANASLAILGNKTIAVPAAISVWRGFDFQASTLTLAAGGAAPNALSLAYLAAPTITSAAAYTVPTAATLTIAGPPVAAGSVTITHPWSFQVLSGNTIFGTQDSLGTASPMCVSFGGTVGTSAVGSDANIKWRLYDDGSVVYGIGMSSYTMALQVPSLSAIAFTVSTYEAARIDRNYNFVIGATAAGATAVKCLALSNGATAPTTSVDLCHLYCADNGAGHATLAIYQEEVVAAVGIKLVTEYLPVVINGVVKNIALVA